MHIDVDVDVGALNSLGFFRESDAPSQTFKLPRGAHPWSMQVTCHGPDGEPPVKRKMSSSDTIWDLKRSQLGTKCTGVDADAVCRDNFFLRGLSRRRDHNHQERGNFLLIVSVQVEHRNMQQSQQGRIGQVLIIS